VPGKPFNRYHPVELVDCCGISEVGSLFGAHSVQSGSPLRRWPIPATAGQPTYPARIFQAVWRKVRVAGRHDRWPPMM
jgi:hypothetical protein